MTKDLMKNHDVILKRAIENLKESAFNSWISGYYAEHKNRIGNDFELIKKITNNKKVKILDVGSLPGILLLFLKRSNYDVIGLDLAPERAREFLNVNKLDILRCDIEKEKFPFEKESFGIVILNETFEHLRVNPMLTLKEIYRVLKPGGTLILSTPNLYSLRNIFSFFRGRGINDPVVEFGKLEKYGHMGHIREYSCNEMKNFLRAAGFCQMSVDYNYYAKHGKSLKSILKFLFYNAFIKHRPFLVFTAVK